VKKKAKALPSAVSEYMAAMAHKTNAVLKGTTTARDRASKAAKARWAKHGAKKGKPTSPEPLGKLEVSGGEPVEPLADRVQVDRSELRIAIALLEAYLQALTDNPGPGAKTSTSERSSLIKETIAHLNEVISQKSQNTKL
jgi:hypothetical protein